MICDTMENSQSVRETEQHTESEIDNSVHESQNMIFCCVKAKIQICFTKKLNTNQYVNISNKFA